MISRGKRRYIKKQIATHLWNKLPKEEQERLIGEQLKTMMNHIACTYNIPVRMLYGLATSETRSTTP